MLSFARKGRDRQSRDHVIDRCDPAVSQDRLQLADVPFDDFEVGAALEALAQEAGEIRVALDRDNPATRLDMLADDPGDRPGARAELDQNAGLIPGDVPQRRGRQPTTTRRDAGDGRPLLEELA